jgi:hypothetical protein
MWEMWLALALEDPVMVVVAAAVVQQWTKREGSSYQCWVHGQLQRESEGEGDDAGYPTPVVALSHGSIL